ncbi:GntP family permease [Pararhodonellum marinum]|uniref:GntP family permease n=1 Tax=Pararhodonellum marinum TaxID=2755358 RepID=UPI00188EBEE3|nr:GntP family permease [Pararhodonellum marinum]
MNLLLLHIIGAIIWIILGTSKLKLHPLICLVTASIWVGMAAGFDFLGALEAFAVGFGALIGQIGLIIILGSVFGVLLEKSRAAVSIAEALWQGIGKKIPALSTTFMGVVVGIPVFCDSGFILLNPIGKNLAKTSGYSPLTFALSLAGGLYLAHILIPPTPGPLAVTGIFGMEKQLGLVLVVGILVSIPVMLVAAWWAMRFKHIFPESKVVREPIPEPETLALAKPSAFASATVIALPLLLITLGNLTDFLTSEILIQLFLILGNPIVAIATGLTLGFMVLKDPSSKNPLMGLSFRQGIEIAGPILILTGAGAGFGAILKQSGLEQLFENLDLHSASYATWILLAYGLTAFLKTAQGSSTSAMIISASIVLSILPVAFQDQAFGTVLIISSIGAGAMTISHANDSYFWIVKEFTGLTVKEALKSYSLLTGLMGITALVTVLVLSLMA